MPAKIPVDARLPIALALCLAWCLTGCSGAPETLNVRDSEALLMREAPAAIAIARRAIAGRPAEGEARWAACGNAPIWRYSGWAWFTAPEGDLQAQLQAIRAALLAAGYTGTPQAEGYVAVERGHFQMTITHRMAMAKAPAQWRVSLQTTPCSRFTRSERDHIEANMHTSTPLPLSGR